jgi:hypothetical protein
MRKFTDNEINVLRSVDEAQNVIRCACDNKPCAGLCRNKNLTRKREDGAPCPAAFIPQRKRVRRERRHHED